MNELFGWPRENVGSEHNDLPFPFYFSIFPETQMANFSLSFLLLDFYVSFDLNIR